MAAYGIPEEEMVKLLINPKTKRPIDEKTLRSRFRDELDRGFTNANVRVMNGMFKNATTPLQNAPGGHPILQIFWAKTRMRWRQADDRPWNPKHGDEPPKVQEDVNMLEAARRLAFVITMGAQEAARQGAAAPKPLPAKKAVRA